LVSLIYNPSKENEFQIIDEYMYESECVRVNVLGRIFFNYSGAWFTVGAMFYELEAKHKLPKDVLEEIDKAIIIANDNRVQK
jgi:hypothetical protein